ncbi:MAG: flagellar biosynthetic protein FliQ [Pseudomonadota bacterium]
MLSDGLILDVLRAGLWTALKVSLPVLGVTLVVGVAIGLLQALTSVQEMTLTFVPKLIAIVVVFWSTMGGAATLLVNFFHMQIVPAVAGF